MLDMRLPADPGLKLIFSQTLWVSAPRLVPVKKHENGRKLSVSFMASQSRNCSQTLGQKSYFVLWMLNSFFWIPSYNSTLCHGQSPWFKSSKWAMFHGDVKLPGGHPDFIKLELWIATQSLVSQYLPAIFFMRVQPSPNFWWLPI